MSGSESRFPKSLIEFQGRFASESACAEYLFERRWPEGFVCPGCSEGRAWLLKTKASTYECAGCGRQTSVTAGTISPAEGDRGLRQGRDPRFRARRRGPQHQVGDGQ